MAEQIRAVAGDIGVDAAKTGMLASAAIVEAVAEAAAELSLPNIVVDPVFVSKHGHPLLADDAVDALRRSILPLATLVTPNLPEAAGLAGFEVVTRDDMRRAAATILALGPRAVLVKGGHLEGDRATDLFVDAGAGGVARGRSDRHAAHARHRLHVVLGDHRAPGPGGDAARRGPRGEGVRHGGDPPRPPDRRRDRAGRPAVVDPGVAREAAGSALSV